MRYCLILIFIFVLLSVPPVYSIPGKIISLDLLFDKNDNVEIINLGVWYGSLDKMYDMTSKYRFEILDSESRIVLSNGIAVSFFAYGEVKMYNSNATAPSEIIEYDESHVFLRLPYSPEYKDLNIYKESKLIFNTDLGELLCNNNNICDGYENYLSCRDCGNDSKDGFCNKILDGVCDGDCETKEDSDCIIFKNNIDTKKIIDSGRNNSIAGQPNPVEDDKKKEVLDKENISKTAYNKKEDKDNETESEDEVKQPKSKMNYLVISFQVMAVIIIIIVLVNIYKKRKKEEPASVDNN